DCGSGGQFLCKPVEVSGADPYSRDTLLNLSSADRALCQDVRQLLRPLVSEHGLPKICQPGLDGQPPLREPGFGLLGGDEVARIAELSHHSFHLCRGEACAGGLQVLSAGDALAHVVFQPGPVIPQCGSKENIFPKIVLASSDEHHLTEQWLHNPRLPFHWFMPLEIPIRESVQRDMSQSLRTLTREPTESL